MEFSAHQIAEVLEGKVSGNGDVKLNNVAKIEEAKTGDLAFLANLKYATHLYTTEASAVLVNEGFIPEKDTNATLIYVKDAYQAFASLLDMVAETMFQPKVGVEQPCFIHEGVSQNDGLYVGAFAYIGKDVKLGKNVKIYPQCYIGDNVIIGDDCTIYSGAKIYHACSLGNNVTIHSGVVVGSDGFGFAPTDTANYKKIPQIGNVIIEDYVEIGANTTVDRATMGSTIIRKGVKLDNQIQIGHNVEIGENTVMAAQTGIAGSVKIGKNCMFGGQVGIAGHLEITDGVKLAAKSGISGDIKEKDVILMGAPAYPIRDYQRSYIVQRKLPELKNRVHQLEKELKALKENQ